VGTPSSGGASAPAAPAAAASAAAPAPSAATPAGGEAKPQPAGGGAKPQPAAAPTPEKPKEPAFVEHVLAKIEDASWQWRHGYAEIKVPRESLLAAANALRNEGFDYLSFITEVDWQDRLELIYHLYAYDFHAQPMGAILRTDLPREALPTVASVTSVWPGAEFMEREAFEMMGISFLGHPDLRRILLPDDFVGFPMRRDYETNYEYITVKQLVHESD
jgi:NADH-quinone oxidoreductase subunit C